MKQGRVHRHKQRVARSELARKRPEGPRAVGRRLDDAATPDVVEPAVFEWKLQEVHLIETRRRMVDRLPHDPEAVMNIDGMDQTVVALENHGDSSRSRSRARVEDPDVVQILLSDPDPRNLSRRLQTTAPSLPARCQARGGYAWSALRPGRRMVSICGRHRCQRSVSQTMRALHASATSRVASLRDPGRSSVLTGRRRLSNTERARLCSIHIPSRRGCAVSRESPARFSVSSTDAAARAIGRRLAARARELH